jgi:hypothetical protein
MAGEEQRVLHRRRAPHWPLPLRRSDACLSQPFLEGMRRTKMLGPMPSTSRLGRGLQVGLVPPGTTLPLTKRLTPYQGSPRDPRSQGGCP